MITPPNSSGSKSRDLLKRREQIVPRGVGVYNTASVERAEGAIIHDVDGRELLDFAGGIGVVNAGHCPESVVRAIAEQAARYIHTSFSIVTYEPYLRLCEELTRLLPHDGPTKAMLVSTGAEAVENAIKIARQATRKQAVLCYTGAFHGRTMMAMTLTSKIGYKLNCGPFAPEVYRIPFPNYYRYKHEMSEDEFAEWELKRLQECSHNVVDPGNIAAIIIELVQGEGGFNPAPLRYVQGLRQFCDEHEIALIFDEIQSGFCRTGHWASWQGYGVTPDISTYAKSMGSGMPIAAVVGKTSFMDAAQPGTLGGTYMGNPVCCAAALATIDLMKSSNLNARAISLGAAIRERFESMKAAHPCIGDVRGMGAMIAMEFVKNHDPQQPDSDTCAKVTKRCTEQGLILITAGTFKNVIRVLCPIVITDEQLQRGLNILDNSLRYAAEDDT